MPLFGCCQLARPGQRAVFKTLLIMNLTIAFLLAVCIGAHATGFPQGVSISAKNTSIEKVFKEINRQTNYTFVYTSSIIRKSKHVNINVQNASIEEVLELCIKEQPLSYTILNKMVVFKEKPVEVRKEISTPAEPEMISPEAIITGRIVDEKGEPLEGVTIIVKGTTTGTKTGADGTFSINAPANASLVVSYVGFETTEIKADKSNLSITLLPSVTASEQVVVVAYGTQKKATLTGAISTISTKEIKQSPAANLAVTLAGRLPGLFAQQTSGEPGRDATALFMRGRGTVNGSSPLILVDGVERELTAINPNEVETVSILKDASSTALFGVRGANGVILVTTKRGTETIPTIGLSVEQGMQDFTRRPSTLSSYEWAQLKNQAWKNDFPTPAANNAPPYSAYALERFKLQDQPIAYPNNNWVDILLKKFVPQTRYNLTINGKGPNVGYFVNVGYLDQSGQWKIDPQTTAYDPSQYLKRYNFRSNIDAILNKARTLKMFLNVAGSLERVNGPFVDARYDNNSATTEIVSRILSRWPVVQPGPTTPNGEVLVGGGNYGESPWGYMNRTGYRKETRSSVTATWGMNMDFSGLVKGLSGQIMLSFDTRSVHLLNASRQFQYWVQVIDPNTRAANGGDSVTYSRTRTDFDNTALSTGISASFQSFYNSQFQLNYNRTFASKHQVTGLLLATQQALIRPSDPLPFNVRGLATRMTYTYDNRYIGEFNAGYNGSEQFAKGRRYGFFPSVSAGWNIHNENFFDDVAGTVNLLKLRGSYGEVGGDQLGSTRFLYLDNISRGSGSYSATLARGGNINEAFFGNPNVQWEVAQKANIGLEVGLFKEISITIDAFREKRNNVLIFRGSIPAIIGVASSSLAPSNIGVVENKGYEIQFDYRKSITSDLSVLAKLNFNYAANKILFNDEVQLATDYAYRYRSTGYQIGQQFGYKVLGFYNSQDEITKSGLTYQGRAPRPGDLIYADLNGDKLIDDRDIMPVGESSVPKYSWGTAFNVMFKNLDISVLFQGAFGVTGQINAYEQDDFRTRHTQAWTPERAAAGDPVRFPALSLSVSSSETSNSYFNENKSYVRLKNLEIGYTLPTPMLTRLAIKNVRLYVNGLNLITWDKLQQKDWDPELGSITSYPVYRVMNAGLNINF